MEGSVVCVLLIDIYLSSLSFDLGETSGERANELVTSGEASIPYPSSKVPKFHLNSLIYSLVSCRRISIMTGWEIFVDLAMASGLFLPS